MGKGLGSMQRAILKALPNDGRKVDTRSFIYDVGYRLEEWNVVDSAWTECNEKSFYRALNSLEKKGLITWKRGRGHSKITTQGFVSMKLRGQNEYH